MPEVWQFTLREFLGDFPVDEVPPGEAAEIERIYGREVLAAARGWRPSTLRRLPGPGGDLFLARIRGRPHDVALVRRLEGDDGFEAAGGYVDEYLWVSPAVRGRGAAAELVLAKAAAIEGPVHAERYTPAGHRATARAHALAVARALAAGCRVSAVVLADYPDLARRPPSARPWDRSRAA